MLALFYINETLRNYQPLLNALVAASTFFAVVIALWSSREAAISRRIRIRFTCDIKSIHEPHYQPDGQGGFIGEPTYRYDRSAVCADILNSGLRSARLPWLAFGMMVPWARAGAIINPITDYRDRAPIELAEGRSASLELRSQDQLKSELLQYPIKWFPRFRIPYVKFTVCLENGDVFKAKKRKGAKIVSQRGFTRV